MNYQICSNCVMDNTDSQISFDDSGVCDHCQTFYEKILPNLGWNKLEEMKFQRDDEVLILKYDKKDKIIFLTFNILPNKNF